MTILEWVRIKIGKIIHEVQANVGTGQRMWMGRYIISLDKWWELYKMNPGAPLNYIPDTFDIMAFQTVKDEQWIKDYLDCMEQRQDREYSEWRCSHCTLAEFDIIGKAISKYTGFGEPCKVLDWFKCPCNANRNLMYDTSIIRLLLYHIGVVAVVDQSNVGRKWV